MCHAKHCVLVMMASSTPYSIAKRINHCCFCLASRVTPHRPSSLYVDFDHATMKLRAIESKSFSGKVVRHARVVNWNKVYELIRHEECDVNEVDRQGRSPLIYAAMTHDFQVIRDLRQFGANMEHVDVNAMGIRHYMNATKESNMDDTMDIRLSAMDMKLTAPTRAAKNGSPQDLYLCIELGCNLNKMDGYGHTPLLIACKERETSIVDILITQCNRHTVDIDKPDGNGRTAAIIATQYGYNDVLQLLLAKAHDIDITKTDNEGKTAFEHAMACNQKKCAKLIFDHQEKSNQMPQILTNTNIANGKQNSVDDMMPPPQIDIKEEEEEAIIKEDDAGDEIDHPIATDNMLETPAKGNATPFSPCSPIKLHESDSIDRRIYRAMTLEQLQHKAEEEEEEDQPKPIQILITSTDP
eukprot:1072370_1